MKLAICFTVFDGIELLEKAILSAQEWADDVIVCWQEISNRGHQSKTIESDLLALQILLPGPDIHLVKYETNLTKGTKFNERVKHNLMMEVARARGNTHFVMAATDHFYLAQEVEYAKRVVLESGFDVTFTAMYTYYKFPSWQLTPREDYYMPFICELTPETKIERVGAGYPIYVDPSVQVTPCKRHSLFTDREIMLHHYSMVRVNMYEKFKNAASGWNEDQMAEFLEEHALYNLKDNPGVKYFQGRKIVEVPDYFGLNSIFEPQTTQTKE